MPADDELKERVKNRVPSLKEAVMSAARVFIPGCTILVNCKKTDLYSDRELKINALEIAEVVLDGDPCFDGVSVWYLLDNTGESVGKNVTVKKSDYDKRKFLSLEQMLESLQISSSGDEITKLIAESGIFPENTKFGLKTDDLHYPGVVLVVSVGAFQSQSRDELFCKTLEIAELVMTKDPTIVEVSVRFGSEAIKIGVDRAAISALKEGIVDRDILLKSMPVRETGSFRHMF